MLSTRFFEISLILYVAATLTYIFYLFLNKENLGKFATRIIVSTFLCHTVGIVLRWKESYDLGFGHIPLTSLFEAVILFSWLVVLIYIGVEYIYKYKVLGAFVIPLSIIALVYSTFLSDEIKPIIPQLQSYWLYAHAITCFLGYAAFTIAFTISIISLFKIRVEKKEGKEEESFLSRLPNVKELDLVNYKVIAFGFSFFTIGMFSGAYWSYYLYGTYWDWSSKDTGMLLTWLIYATFLHLRLNYGWVGTRSAIISIIGFSFSLILFFAVNLIITGVH